jgi:hypothetical protein
VPRACDLSKVDSLFKEMIAEGIKPTVVTYSSMIDAFSKGGDFGGWVVRKDEGRRGYEARKIE